MLHLEQLESRDTPSVTFNFDYSLADPNFFTPAAHRALEAAGHAIGDYLNPVAGQPSALTIRVFVSDLPGALGQGGPTGPDSGAVFFDHGTSWHFGITDVGLNRTKTDFFSVAGHELLHVLGLGTRPGWDDAARTRGTPIAPDGQHLAEQTRALSAPTVAPGVRKLPTDFDFAILADLGWNPSPRPVGPYLYSVALPGGLIELTYIDSTTGAYFSFTYRSPYHFVIADYNYDGVPDLRIASTGPGFDAVIDGRTGGFVDDPVLSFGTLLLNHFADGLTNHE